MKEGEEKKIVFKGKTREENVGIQRKVYNMFSMKCNQTEIVNAISLWMMEKYCFKTLFGKRGNDIWIYRGGVFVDCGRQFIEEEVENILDEFSKKYIVQEVVAKIERSTFVEREELGCKDVNLICLENGVFSLKEKKLLEHSEKYGFISKIPIYYDEKARWFKIESFLYDVLYEEDVRVFQEMLGYLLYRNYFIKKGFIFVGGADTGKTTVLNLLGRFLGEKNICGISLQKLSSDKFSGAHLYNKMANLYDDLSSTDISDTGAFKVATGGGYITGEFKFGGQFVFKNFAKLIFATNVIPNTSVNKEEDLAYYKRWIVFRFENIFEGSKVDKKLLEKLITTENMSGLLNWALIGLGRLLEKERFSYDKDLDEVVLLMQRHSSDVAKFVQDCCEEGEEFDWMDKDVMYEHYKEYCRLNKFGIITKIEFGRSLCKWCNYVLDSRQGQDTGWRNVRVKKIKPICGI